MKDVLLRHPKIKECAVVGVPDNEWGEIVAASIIVSDKNIDFNSLKVWAKELLPAYKIPRKFIVQDELPRNTLGKVTKKVLKKAFD